MTRLRLAELREGVWMRPANLDRPLPAGARLSLRLHIPFCERLCWFCSSRTQRLRGPEPVADFLAPA